MADMFDMELQWWLNHYKVELLLQQRGCTTFVRLQSDRTLYATSVDNRRLRDVLKDAMRRWEEEKVMNNGSESKEKASSNEPGSGRSRPTNA